MKKFSFDLQEILNIRQYEQEKAESELAKALGRENEINQNLQLLASQLTQARNNTKNSTDFNDIVALNQFQNLIDYQKEELLKQLASAKIITEQKKSVLAECMKKTNALEKLKEAQKEDFDKQVSDAEKKFIDELGSQGYFRANFISEDNPETR